MPRLTTRIACGVLSHYSDLFPQVSSWLLFTVGCMNMLAVGDIRTVSR